MRKLITLAEAAEQLGVTLAAIRDWRFRRKHLDFVKVGRAVRVLQSSIDNYIDRQTVPAADGR
jgi:excisionase family DNA binding protein